MKNLRRYSRQLSLILCFTFLYELVFPIYSYALTGGPSQPEVQGFTPVGTSDMVDIFSGDFKYNIPLMEVDGYPLNISYSGGINTDQEASWVGLGWNLNPGAITRNMRGIPDDFNGDAITKEIHMKPNTTYGMNAGVGVELVGLPLSLNGNVGLFHNNYAGLGIEFGGGFNVKMLEKGGGKLSAGLQMNYNAASGINISPSLNFSYKMESTEAQSEGTGSLNLSSSFNSRMGMKALNFGYSLSYTKNSIKEDKKDPKKNKQVGEHTSDYGGGGSLITYGKETFTPSISTPMRNFNLRLNFKFGTEIFGANGNFTFAGYISQQKIAQSVITRPAFGYYYFQDKSDGGMMDMNREKDMPFTENHTNLPLPVNTPDFFSVTAQGIGGNFRVYRNDIPNFCQDNIVSKSYDTDAGFELGAANTFKGGGNVSFVRSKDESGNWLAGNELQNNMKLVGKSALPTIPEYEPAYIRQTGEPTVSNIYKNARMGGDRLMSPVTYTGYADNSITQHSSDNDITGPKNTIKVTDANEGVQKLRQPRNMVFSHLTAVEANSHGLQQNILSYDWNQLPEEGTLTPKKGITRYGEKRKPHHISEITILNTDGKRYIYGIPAYNNEQTEATFALGNGSSAAGDIETGLAQYSHGIHDNPNSNNYGKDNFVQKVKTPGYAYSYLLTGVVSPDYVDYGGGGITDNDFGTSTRINYSLRNDAYSWRVPYEGNSVSYMEGQKSDYSDDKGSYIYGTKELWYVHSVEGKNHIAMFYISPRLDALGALPQGGQDIDMQQYQLDSIVLYAKQDFLKNGISAYRIKAVHFDYDYVLCKDVPNFISQVSHPVKGKLTLKKLWFTYGTSHKGKLSKYEFNYNDEGATGYAYSSKAQDRWGTYKPNVYDGLPSSEFPFTPQNKSDADNFAAAWSLSEVILPSGGKIKVEYEADDYAYVQNRKAMVMYKIKGFSDIPDASLPLETKLFSVLPHKEYSVMYVDIGSSVSPAQLDDIMGGLKDVQVNVFADINGKGIFKEYVKGYVDIEQGSSNYGICSNISNTIWIRLKKEEIEVGKVSKQYVNPISKVIWNYARIYTPDLISLSKVSANENLNKGTKIFTEMAGFFTEVWSMIEGIYSTLRKRQFGRDITEAKSWVRLNAKDMVKYGGGHRVKSVKINDHWAYMGSANTNAADYEYGQEYDYTMEQKDSEGNIRSISSGVAAYEPTIGNDENPWHQPQFTRSEYKGVPNLLYMVDEPYGESFFPAATVGYSKVTVRNIPRSGVERTATGKQVHEFYTAYDFPVKATWSNIQTDLVKPDFVQEFLNFDKKEETKVTASQGYKIEVNDMHGKAKAEYTYSQTSKDPIAGVEYYYNHVPGNANELSNVVKVVDQNGDIQEKELGLEVELFNDFRQNLSQISSSSADVNIDLFMIGVIPVPLPTFFGSYSETYTDVKTAVMVKLVNRYGIQTKTVAIKEGSRIKTENLLYDEITGNVLVSSVENEFDDNIYNLSYPAHWAYDRGMGPAYKNIGFEIHGVVLELDSIKFPSGLNVRDYLVPGDEVELKYQAPGYTQRRSAYVYEGKANRLNIIDRYGISIYGSQTYSLKVLRSGRRNLHNIPIQQLSTWHYPIAGTGSNMELSIDSVISASAVEYDEYWPFYCDKLAVDVCDSSDILGPDILQDLFNQLAAEDLFKSRKQNYSISCLTGIFLSQYPGVNAGEFYKQTGNYPDYNYLRITSDSCLDCDDELYGYNESTQTYHGLGAHNFESCKTDTGCCENQANIRSFVDNHAVYEVMRQHLSTISGGCANDTTLEVEMNTCTSSDGGTSYELVFNRCDMDCKLNFILPFGTCFTDIASFSDIVITTNDSFAGTANIFIPEVGNQSVSIRGGSDCINFRQVSCSTVCETPNPTTILNPYRQNMLGSWRIKRNHSFLAEREYATANVNPRYEGVYDRGSYSNFWIPDAGKPQLKKTTNPKWVWSSQVTMYTPYGNEIENQDALGRYSSALFGFNKTLPTAVAGNARYKQIAFESFEENDLFWVKSDCYRPHWEFAVTGPGQAEISSEARHTGKYSIKVSSGNSSFAGAEINGCSYNENPLDSVHVKWTDCNCVGVFSPDTGTYVISGWLKQGNDLTDTAYLTSGVKVNLVSSTGTSTQTIYASGPIIDGWQRYYAEFHVDLDVTELEVELFADNEDTWFDDVRIHPFDASMKTYVYDQVTLRLLAELDDNNYAAIYEYDLEGALSRIKKETVKGIQTLKEIRKSILKTNP